MALPIPSTLEDLTPSWLTEALRGAGLEGTTVAAADVEPLGAESHGFLCILGRVTPTYSAAPENAPKTLIAKLPKKDAHIQEFGKTLRAWEMESLAYSRLLPHLDVRTARCFYNGCDVEKNEYALLLEDLGGLTGASLLAGPTPTQARLAIRWLAGLHATWWGSRELATNGWLSDEKSYDTRSLLMIQALWETFRTIFSDEAPSRVFEWIEKLIPTYAEPVVTAFPPTLVHHDMRADNLFFDGNRSMIAVDWQLVCRGPAMLDVAYFLGSQMSVEQRRASERELLAEYREALLERGVDPGSLEDVFDLYGLYVLRLAAYVVIAATMMNDPDPTSREVARNGVLRALAAADDLDVGRFLER